MGKLKFGQGMVLLKGRDRAGVMWGDRAQKIRACGMAAAPVTLQQKAEGWSRALV